MEANITLADLAKRVQTAHARCVDKMGETLSAFCEAGEALLEAKKMCGHGEWAGWLAKNFPASERTAQVYMRTAKRWAELPKAQRAADLSLRDVMALLSRPSLVVDPEFAALLPACSEYEDAMLEEAMVNDGCLDSIKVWKGHNIILDGHRRYRICQKRDIDYRVQEVEAEDRTAAKILIIRWQLGRKNLSEYEKGVESLKISEATKRRASGETE